MIETLVIFKRYLSGDSPLESKLRKLEFSSMNEEDNLPTNQELSKELEIPRVKLNKELRVLYEKFIEGTWDSPPEIKEVFHTIVISIPYDERKQKHGKNWYYEPDERSTHFRLKLTHTPRIGEQLDLSFIERNEKFKRGYVYDISHCIYGDVHDIQVHVHPFKNYYHQWEKMKDEHEWWERQRRNW
ncbi:hypothetical protein [Ekhidna lutea]|nr:hypothetical protein [Ekhidna lutea]